MSRGKRCLLLVLENLRKDDKPEKCELPPAASGKENSPPDLPSISSLAQPLSIAPNVSEPGKMLFTVYLFPHFFKVFPNFCVFCVYCRCNMVTLIEYSIYYYSFCRSC